MDELRSTTSASV